MSEAASASALEDAVIADQPPVDEHDRVYLVPYRWWKEAQESQEGSEITVRGIPYTVSPAPSSYGNPMKLIGTIFSSDLVFNLRRDDDAVQYEAEDRASGRCYALIASDLWSQALKWYNASSSAICNGGNSLFAEDDTVDVYPLKLKILVARDANVMAVKITKKDNVVENYKRAFKIFSVDSESVRIWDFSGHTELIFMNEWNRMARDGQRQSDQEIPLELQVYALSESMSSRNDFKKDDRVVQQSMVTSLPYGGSLAINGNIGNMDADSRHSGSSRHLGLTGLENLGNTCFMNSAVQCLAHTPKLVEYFRGDYSKEINYHNPLGMDGEIALAFGELLRKLWSSDKTPVTPRVFKAKLARFAPQFSGFNQHDSQEFLAFLLDGLHEDLNRVKHKPYIEAKDACGRPDEEAADEYWANHLARNNSIIVDVCQGQYRSTLVCPVCKKVSVTFDPFMYLTLPLSSPSMRTMTIMVLSTDGSMLPSSFTINVPKYGKCKDLIQALGVACSLKDDEYLLVAEVFCSRIIRYLEDPADSLNLIRDGDRFAAYRLPKDSEKHSLVVFSHQRMEEKMSPCWKAFGVPLISRLPASSNGSTVRNLFLKLLSPFRQSADNQEKDNGPLNELVDMDESSHVSSDDDDKEKDSGPLNGLVDMDESSHVLESEEVADTADVGESFVSDFHLYLTDEKSQEMISKIEANESISETRSRKQLHVLVSWQEKALGQYDICLLNSLPEVYKSSIFLKRPQESVSLYGCLETFLKEEPLGPEDMWYCPSCKEHRQASKKLDLWRLPEVLVIHLKRFSYSRFMKNKLGTLVEFPIQDLDLSAYITHKTKQPSPRYALYAISNHYGNLGGGHYTAYVYHEGQNCWFDFDDRHVFPKSEDSIKTSAAYVLFYKRIQSNSSDT